MSRRTFLEQDTKHRATEVIRKIEAETSAEVVVSVRRAASRYWRSCVVFGGACGAVVLLVMLLSPTVYHWLLIGADALLTFAVATLVCQWIPGLKLALTSSGARDAALSASAEAAFRELGVGKTKERTGVLVLVSLLERKLVVRADTGVPIEMMGERYPAALERMQQGVDQFDENTFLDGLLALTEPLAQVLPRSPDDVNELSDDVA